jgi:uncharacterized protein (TIGR03435 family)
MRIVAFLGCAAFLSGLALSQSTEIKPAFEIADVHISPPSRNPFMRGPVIRRGHYEVRYATMVDLIKTAYAIDAERVLGGPRWLETDTYDVTAKPPTGTTVETAKPMLRTLLADRFKLVFHNDTKSIPAYAPASARNSRNRTDPATPDVNSHLRPLPLPAHRLPGRRSSLTTATT